MKMFKYEREGLDHNLSMKLGFDEEHCRFKHETLDRNQGINIRYMCLSGNDV